MRNAIPRRDAETRRSAQRRPKANQERTRLHSGRRHCSGSPMRSLRLPPRLCVSAGKEHLRSSPPLPFGLPDVSFFFLLGRDLGAWDYVFVGGPVAQVDEAAAFAAKREIGVVTSHRFLTDRASHHTATKGEILMNAEAAGGGAVSVGGSSVPTTS